MRKTEIVLGVCAGVAGLLLAVFSALSLLPYLAEYSKDIQTGAVICMIANAAGIVGAFIVHKSNMAGAAVMAACLIVILFYGFPWQSIPAVMYVVSVVMAAVPVKMSEKEIKEGVR
jgi:hypothetical protein